jgi:hypothetical protein
VPETDGGAVLAGGRAATAAVGALTAATLPSEFAPVTSTRSVRPTSAATTP